MTIKDETISILQDLEWHCSQCELPAAQAKTYQILRQEGYELDTTVEGGYYSNLYCNSCQRITVHRRLVNPNPVNESTIRVGLSSSQKSLIKDYYQNRDLCLNRQRPPRELEIDHKFPQIRWSSDEKDHSGNYDPETLARYFQPLTRSNNLLKSRDCEHCTQTNERATPFGIRFWYCGGPHWEYEWDDERGCIGCFWYDPDQWREALNRELK